MNKRELIIERYLAILELYKVKREIKNMRTKLTELHNRRQYLTNKILDNNYYIKYFKKEPLKEPKYTV